MARTPLLRALVDRAVPGGLNDFLESRRNAGDSYAAIARALHSKHDIAVTAETVRVWCIDLGISDRSASGAAS